jgi:benzoyl-CoA-dihydrodiol lyase
LPDDRPSAPRITPPRCELRLVSDGHGQSRLARRFYDEAPALDAVRAIAGQPLDADAAFALGLVTSNPDDIDWADEIRIAIEDARGDVARCAHRPGSEPALQRPREHGHPRLRPPDRLAELDLPAPQRRRREGRAEGLRQGRQAAFDWNRV